MLTKTAVALAGAMAFAGLGTTAASATPGDGIAEATYRVGTLELCIQYGDIVTGPGKQWWTYACWRDASGEYYIDLME
ncbi:hypothetical protein RM844_15355 [Streptomyces sp. DSM 44915]|uniref:Uncharacterized protein n=2 Tax=Streptomyces chisholmiae TaxID=3075540 RepID=A0ABU2JRP5_9ACTN|nr:hypothetical protein [Streptomyces sp. DSM 44915]